MMQAPFLLSNDRRFVSIILCFYLGRALILGFMKFCGQPAQSPAAIIQGG